ncbi:MAG: hypothetical protein MUO63_09040 [Desulfobulbaceae bacterium]|nr:hypothetical protein [Desulfobulbaceae bacterium]
MDDSINAKLMMAGKEAARQKKEKNQRKGLLRYEIFEVSSLRNPQPD